VPVTAFHLRVAVDAAGGGDEEGDEVAGETINVTGILWVNQVPSLTVMVALYVPAARPLVLTATVRVARVVSDWLAGDTVSQVALSEAVSVALYVGVFVKVSVCFGGFVAPCTAW
jgi:hypothetical protein